MSSQQSEPNLEPYLSQITSSSKEISVDVSYGDDGQGRVCEYYLGPAAVDLKGI